MTRAHCGRAAAGAETRQGRRDLGAQLAWIALYSFALLLALRFGARTYPGFWHPESLFLNWLLNGSTLFTVIGYNLVLVAGCAAVTRILIGASSPGSVKARRVLAIVQGAATLPAIAIILYGLQCAIFMHRLPWQDG